MWVGGAVGLRLGGRLSKRRFTATVLTMLAVLAVLAVTLLI
jgi:predicted MFS family arabinose efflux permease